MDLPGITRKEQKKLNKIVGYKPAKPGEEVGLGELSTDILTYLKLPWYFEKPYEKIILLVMFGLGAWKLIGLIKWIL